MEIIIFGLSISSSWGNGHATLLRGLFRALHDRGHRIHFFEKDAPYYAAHRDMVDCPFADLRLYGDFNEVAGAAKTLANYADAAIVTSYCADGADASDLILNSRAASKLFYDMDTPVTFSRLDRGEAVPYLPASGLQDFDLALSYTGGDALTQLCQRLGAKRAEALYGWVDPAVYHPAEVEERYRADLSYLGTYAADRQTAVEQFLLKAARELEAKHFVVGGAMYPDTGQWPKNVRYYDHVPPSEHRAFYSSSSLTLNVTRGAMAAMGYCPSGRLFEAAACGTAVISDWWTGLDEFFERGEEILIGNETSDVKAALLGGRGDLRAIGKRARERTLDCHTADIRAARLIQLIESVHATVPEWAAAQGA